MKYTVVLIFMTILFFSSCKENKEEIEIKSNNFETRIADNIEKDSLKLGATYLPVYSHVYQMHGNNNLYLTITTSIRNTSTTDSIYVFSADYYNTSGEKIRKYINKPIYIKPLETIEIIIEQVDKEGGSGANFIFNWGLNDKKNIPLIEAVMISTYGQQGVSFTTKGTQIYK